MSTHNVCFYKKIDIQTNLKTTKLIDCALTGIFAVIRLNILCNRINFCFW